MTLVVLQGGGHVASLALHAAPRVNPLWTPCWQTVEPWAFKASRPSRWGGSRLLASVSGHLLCLGYFGSPSSAEAVLGQDAHGEAPVARWRLLGRAATRELARLKIGCLLPVAGMRVERTLTLRAGSHRVEVETEIRSTVDRDTPFTVAEHGSVGAPFLEPGVTVFDCSGREGATFPTAFSNRQRLAVGTPFVWPDGPGAAGGVVDLRTLGRRANSDFTAQHLDAARDDAWASAVNPRLGLMIGYHWRRADFPWIGNWEENRCRRMAPWGGRSLVRGMELANTPFPTSLADAVARNTLHGERTYGWLPARGCVTTAFRLFVLPVDSRVRGVSDIRAAGDGLDVDFLM